MSYDSTGGPPQRPRSTPIPDADNGLSLPPQTPAQFLGEQSSLPWTPQPGPSVNAPFAANSGLGFAQPAGGSFLRVFIVIIVLMSVGGAGAIAYFASRTADEIIDHVPTFPQRPSEDQTVFTAAPPLVIPTPSVAVPPSGEPSQTAATAPVVVVPTTVGLETTLPTPPPTTAPPPPATAFPGGVGSLYEGNAARAIVDQFEFVLAGDPSQLTQVYIAPDYAIATAQDPAQPGKLVGAFWRDGALGDASITTTGGDGDLSYQIFSENDVNWDSLAVLVPQAAGLLGIADGQVTSVVVQRVGIGNPPPVVIDVYVEGAAAKGFVEASAAGDVLTVNPG
jgi:hypothetical protein